MKLLKRYKNGNGVIKIYDDGTRTIETKGKEEFKADFPLSMDIKITNYCDVGCPYCHENSGLCGKHGNINSAFISSLKSGTEVALGGGNPLAHPQLEEFLVKFKNIGVLASMTVNQKSLNEKSLAFIESLFDRNLIRGIGVSIYKVNEQLVSFLKNHKTSVLHVIVGVTPYEELKKLFDMNLKVLFLGFKEYTGRGENYYSENNDKVNKLRNELEQNVMSLPNRFYGISFDNKALKQLKIQEKVSKEYWEQFYQGDDGESTMYVDLIKEQFGQSSVSTNRHNIGEKNIIDMFNVIKDEKNKQDNAMRLYKRIESENKGMIIHMKPTATKRQIELAKEIYPDAVVLVDTEDEM